MVIVNCTIDGCEFRTADTSEALAIALLANHGISHQIQPQASTGSSPAPRGPKLERPKVDVGVSIEEWNIFVRRWNVFRAGSGIDDASAPSQLFQCAGTALGDSLLKSNANATSLPFADLLTALRSLAIIPVGVGILRTELLQLRQDRDEAFRTYSARVRGKAETCEFAATCTCGLAVDYTDHIIRDVLLSGILDSDIRREVLGTIDILKKPVNDVIAMVENKEMARNALPSASLSAMSSFRRQKSAATAAPSPSSSERTRQAPCPDCKNMYKLFSEGPNGWNAKPHQVCIACFRARRRTRKLTVAPAPSATPPAVSAVETGHVSQIATILADDASVPHRRRRRGRRNRGRHKQHSNESASSSLSSVVLDHHVFTAGEWRQARLREHPKVAVTISVDHSHRNKTTPCPTGRAEVIAIADTGAMSDLWSLSDFLSCGLTRDLLHPVRLGFSAANRSPISIEGAFFAEITAGSSRSVKTCRSMIYVSGSVKGMYLLYDTMLNLGILPTSFPEAAPLDQPVTDHGPSINVVRVATEGCNAVHKSCDNACSCPQRSATPPRSTSLPFPCTPENNELMKTWLLERYSSLTFNTCPHRSLPCMEGPPVEIHINPHATPKACHTPADIPLHWQKRVYEDLLRDEALGVIERVPYGEPTTWCHRMVVTRKHDGSPRRTVDLSPLNKFCKRETFASESPFHLARRVPHDTWKTVTDAWNGYHSVPLRETDRHLTTFITPFGRWRYTRAPQGFLSSGDGYNRRFDAILSEVQRKERCVDDTIHYDTDLEEHWWRTIDLLTRVGQADKLLNPDKFQFSQKKVDFAGFRISESTIEPLPKYLDAIREFPTPTSTTDVRSWFGLVNQVANYAKLRDIMAPFKPFLSPRCQFSWTPTLEEAFESLKQEIVSAIRRGVEIFDITRRTCLRPEWSRRGVGYFLLQKHCNCPSQIPDCCPDGWLVTLAGSRSLSSAEGRCAAIKGEALAVAWCLEQTKYFTQGCDNLVIVTDHKPLVKIFGDRTLDEITNSRLFRLKQRTLPWKFEIQHLPGTSNTAADAASRHPASSGTTGPNMADLIEATLMAAVHRDV